MRAPFPETEVARLEALRGFAILDTPPEPSYDDLTGLAAYLCQTPIALVSLVDESRQWFKSRFGLDAAETHRDLAFCAHAILAPGEILEVPDTLLDPRFARNALVTGDPKIRFYAGMPLVAAGHPLGTLCVIDRVPRHLDEPQRKALRALARQAAALIESRAVMLRLQQAHAELHSMNAELRSALVAAQHANKVKSAFLAAMSHELRTPLNSIIGFSGTLLQGLAGQLSDEQRKQLGMVSKSARRLLHLVIDVLDISKIEAGEMTVKCAPFDLQASIAKAIATVRPSAQAKGLALVDEASDCGWAHGNARRVEQILLNLLGNAVKFTETGTVTLSVTRDSTQVTVTVTDTGIGIRQEDLASVFESFRQIDDGLARVHEGAGLGLTLCERMAALMGGEVKVQSEVGVSSRFSLSLPVPKAAEAAPLTAPRA